MFNSLFVINLAFLNIFMTFFFYVFKVLFFRNLNILKCDGKSEETCRTRLFGMSKLTCKNLFVN